MTENQIKKIKIDISEREIVTLDNQGGVQKITGNATLNVINSSEKNRLWNLKLKLDNTDVYTNLPKEANNESLEPKNNWEIPFDLLNQKEPILKLTEIIDTSKNEEGINEHFYLNTTDTITITIKVQNITEKSIQDIELKKQIPLYLKNLSIIKSEGNPELDVQSKSLIWKIPNLDPNSSNSIVIEGITEITDSTEKTGNIIDVTYKSIDNLCSGINPHITALTNNMSGIDQEEDGSVPGKWNCELEVENESDFELTLLKSQIDHKITTGEETIVNLEPNAIINPNNSWSHSFSVEGSPSVPQLTSKIDITANYTVFKEIFGKINQLAKKFTVLETSIVKNITPPTVKANANTDIKITNTIENKGTAKIDKILLKDVIPKDFEPPTVEKINLAIFSGNGDKIANLTNENAPISIVPDDIDITKEHNIEVNFFSLENMFIPGNKIVMEYPIIARNPQPNIKYETPITINSNTLPVGAGYMDKPDILPIIGIQYVQRKVKTMKSISPAGKEGAFAVSIKISNKGGVELENISVIEEIPSGFSVGEYQPSDLKPEYREEGAGAVVTWQISRLDAGQSIKLKYTSEGTGEFPRTEPRVIIAESESIKSSSADLQGSVTTDSSSSKSKTSAPVHEILDDLKRKIEKVVPSEKAADLLEEAKDQLLTIGRASPALHEIGVVARDLRKVGSKMLVGSELEKILAKLNEWKQHFSS
ncbi:MAG: hypothetical protein GY870_18075 [archaeon]|nr:hypothetical protein [archaeon]